MLYHLLYPLKVYISGFNVFRYITFRSGAAAILALLISFIIGPYIIRKLREKQIGEEIRKDGPPTHLIKAGTPTMGGLIVLISVLVPTLLFSDLTNQYVWLMILATSWMGLVGYIDDYLKAIKKYPKGLVGRYKMFGQITLGLIIGSILYFLPEDPATRSVTTVPFLKNFVVNFNIFYILVVMLVVTGTSNAVNLTDGLDGLAIGCTAIAFIAFAAMCYITGNVKFASYLNIIYIPEAGELTVFALAMIGASLGFLWYNSYPATVFMGDTGALAIGAALGTMSILIKKELLLVIVGGIFVMEALSVMMQTTYFKYTRKKYGEGRRIFKMAPLHHHFELLGWKESKVVVRFYIIAILLALLTLTTFKVR
jgi:phospho-N-acetylmuramoyl-pentapeptide-transferase